MSGTSHGQKPGLPFDPRREIPRVWGWVAGLVAGWYFAPPIAAALGAPRLAVFIAIVAIAALTTNLIPPAGATGRDMRRVLLIAATQTALVALLTTALDTFGGVPWRS